jgi:cytochrome c553
MRVCSLLAVTLFVLFSGAQSYAHPVSCGLVSGSNDLDFLRLEVVPAMQNQKAKDALNACVSCHSAGGSAHPIPFGDAPALKVYIQANSDFMDKMNKRLTSTSMFFKMPPGGKSLPDGVTPNNILDYLKSL